jgi:hypothetical protein
MFEALSPDHCSVKLFLFDIEGVIEGTGFNERMKEVKYCQDFENNCSGVIHKKSLVWLPC